LGIAAAEQWTDRAAPMFEFTPHTKLGDSVFMIGIWEITAEGEGTRYTATCRHWTEADCQRHAEMGFEAGWGTCADQLLALAEA